MDLDAEFTPLPASNAASPILIVGSGGGIGLFLARRLLETGQSVILTYHSDPKPAVELEMEFPLLVKGCFPFHASTAASAESLFERIRGVTPTLFGLINTVGPWIRKPLNEISDDEFDDLLTGNLTQAFQIARRAHPLLKANQSGRLIHFLFAGVEKFAAYRSIGAYAVAKTGLLSLTKSLAREWRADRITVNAIAPGIVISPDKSICYPRSPTGAAGQTPKVSVTGGPPVTPSHEIIQEFDLPTRPPSPSADALVGPDDIWEGVRYLLSGAASRTTGTVLTVADGFGLG